MTAFFEWVGRHPIPALFILLLGVVLGLAGSCGGSPSQAQQAPAYHQQPAQDLNTQYVNCLRQGMYWNATWQKCVSTR